MNSEQAAALREPFPRSAIGQIPKAGRMLDYCGHAAVTDRLLAVDPCWTWEPFAIAADGTPAYRIDGNDAVMWIRLTVCDVTRPGVGIVQKDSFELEKQLISDALRNAAMRFGVALDLWSKEDLQSVGEGSAGAATTAPSASGESNDANTSASAPAAVLPDSRPAPPQSEWYKPPANTEQKNASTVLALREAGVSVADARIARGLPPRDKCPDMFTYDLWTVMLAELWAEHEAMSAPFTEPAEATP